MNPFQLDQMNEEDLAALEAASSTVALPQPSLEGNSPLAMPNFSNKQVDPVVFTNNLFKGMPGVDETKPLVFDPRVQPMPPDLMEMEPMTIESEAPATKLKALLKKKQELSNPSRAPASVQEKPKEKQEEKKPDDMYAQQGISKILQGLASMGGGKIDDNSDFYEKYRQFQLEKPGREIDNKIKKRNFEKMTKMDDPSSTESVNFRKALSKLAPDLVGLYGKDWEGISANDKESIFDIVKTREQIEGRKDAMRLAKENRNDALDERRRQFDEKMDDKKAQQQKLSEKQVKDLTAYDEGLSLLSNIEATKPQFDTGPVSSRQNALGAMFGMDDAQKSAFKADIQSNVAAYIKSISGSAVSDPERAFLLQNMPTMTDNDATFSAKLTKVKERMERNRSLFLQNVKKSGKNTTEFDNKEVPKIEKSQKTEKNKPKTVIQNGVTYTLNPETNEYE